MGDLLMLLTFGLVRFIFAEKRFRILEIFDKCQLNSFVINHRVAAIPILKDALY